MGLVLATMTYAQTSGFARGADISWCTEMEVNGKVFRNAEGIETDTMMVTTMTTAVTNKNKRNSLI